MNRSAPSRSTAVGRYRLVRPIGRGGMAEVWLAQLVGAERFERRVALKRMLPSLAAQPSLVRMFVEEARIAASLVHSNIVQVYDFGAGDAGDYYLAMEYVEGTTLASLARSIGRRGEKLSLEASLFVAREVARALAHAHADGDPAREAVIHRDVTPQNVLLSHDGEVKLADFGIARVAGGIGGAGDDEARGKLPFMSPEQVGRRAADARSDLFSLGVVLYELLVGEPLFGRGSAEALCAEIAQFRQVDPFVLAQLPAGARRVLAGLLQSSPEMRFPRATDVVEAIDAALPPAPAEEGRSQLRLLARAARPPAVPPPPVETPDAPRGEPSRARLARPSLTCVVLDATQWSATARATRPLAPPPSIWRRFVGAFRPSGFPGISPDPS